jgi:pyruvate, water dikinase
VTPAGETGYVYQGAVPFDVERVDLSQLEHPRTKVMLNVGNPERALALSLLPNG